ncbi:MAG TPA: hypothetical protein VFG74_10390 [Miltoncostaeaceae bacterium]|nr:hypothetical protein [Miltoncostaeaceae bacterium]
MSGMPTLTLDGSAAPPDPAGERMDRALLRVVLLALVEEGRRFAATPDGDRWRRVLAGASAAREGRVLWAAAGLDRFLTGAGDGPGSPRAMADDLRALAAQTPPPAAPPLRLTVAGG